MPFWFIFVFSFVFAIEIGCIDKKKSALPETRNFFDLKSDLVNLLFTRGGEREIKKKSQKDLELNETIGLENGNIMKSNILNT